MIYLVSDNLCFYDHLSCCARQIICQHGDITSMVIRAADVSAHSSLILRIPRCLVCIIVKTRLLGSRWSTHRACHEALALSFI
ncbi:hypothetical protein SERLA73DRAFT_189713 [Serpula lacrymans var. lacrymans S7.3]|uniref:Uncharacterized protein n=1 Tax=Serpula lacrymans var. lacrymans (strain S7.3) TaxID=936435 RepID=F8QEG9_SERL3|nr:hypothetical protein SERLA73DRAFT_189713 [Serpula lacrymans var. lacrymans S7.3]